MYRKKNVKINKKVCLLLKNCIVFYTTHIIQYGMIGMFACGIAIGGRRKMQVIL